MGLAALAVTVATTVFLCGPLLHPPLLRVVLGEVPGLRPARLDGHALVTMADDPMPHPVPRAGNSVVGGLATLTTAAAARLAFYCAALGREGVSARVEAADGPVAALVHLAGTSAAAAAGSDWDPADWAGRWAATETATAGDVVALYGQTMAADVARRRHAMLVRGASRARAAADPAPTTLRYRADPADVAILARRQPYAAFFAVEEYDLTHSRFDGATSEPIRRAVFLSGDAVTVLPYDPVRDRVLLIEQIRVGPIGRGDPQPWQLEAIAGRIDPGETPEGAARREAAEEAGLTLGRFLPVAAYYPSPGAKAEWLVSYVALADLPDGCAGPGGKPEEAEDIRGHLLSWAETEDLLSSGEINNAPLLITLLWLQRERPALRA